MATKVPRMSDINSQGYVIGQPYQEISQQSIEQLYPVGAILDRHGRRFRYCRAYEAISITNRGCPNMANYPWIATSLFTAKFVSCNAFAIGEREITLTVDDYGEDTSPYAFLTKNFFAGGYIYVAYNTNASSLLRVSGSEVGVTSGANTEIKLYLDTPFYIAYAAGTTVDLYCSPYAMVGASTSNTGWSSVVCIPQVQVTADYWFWGQTRGPCSVTPTSAITGTTVRMVYFHSDGTIKDAGTDTSLQLAGYLLFKGDNTQDDNIIQLMLE